MMLLAIEATNAILTGGAAGGPLVVYLLVDKFMRKKNGRSGIYPKLSLEVSGLTDGVKDVKDGLREVRGILLNIEKNIAVIAAIQQRNKEE
jgi:hypothetical protein